MRFSVIFGVALVAVGCAPAGVTTGATTFVLVPKRAELDPREQGAFHHDAQGRMVDRDEEPLVDYCRDKCKYVVPPGRAVVGCRDAEATEEVTRTFNIESRALMVCEIK